MGASIQQLTSEGVSVVASTVGYADSVKEAVKPMGDGGRQTRQEEPDAGLVAAFAREFGRPRDTPLDRLAAEREMAIAFSFYSDPPHCELPDWLREPMAGRVFLCWEDGWCEGAVDLVWGGGEVDWHLPKGMRPGDAAITVLGCEPPLVAALERVEAVDGDDQEVSRLVVDWPVSWDAALAYLGATAVRRSHRLPRGVEILAEVVARIEYPSRTLVQMKGDDVHNSTVWTALLLGEKRQVPTCAVCNEPVHPADAVGHRGTVDGELFDPDGQESTAWDLQVARDAAVLLCPDCDNLLHAPTLEDFRRRLRPACPSCLLRDNVAQLVPESTARSSSDDESVGSDRDTVVGLGRRPRWHCRACDVDFCLSEADGGPAGEHADIPPRRQRDRGLYTLREVAKALGRNHRTDGEAWGEIEAALTDHADWDVYLQDDGDPGELVLRIQTTGSALRYPVTLAEIYQAVDDLAHIADEQAEQEYGEDE